MAKPIPGVWGIDVGQSALKALRLQMVEGKLTATAFDFVEYPKNLSQPDADPDQLIREALTQFLSRNNLRGDTVAISVPGQSGLARFVKLPPVEEKKIADIVKFEAKQQIPFNLDEVVWDFQKLGSGEVIDGLALETEIGLFAMKRDMIARYLQHFRTVNVEVHYIQMAPLSLCNYLSYDMLGKDPGTPADGEKKCVVGLDIGTDASNLVVTDGGRIIWQRPIPLGGNHFTRALTKDLKLTFAKAEHMKRNATKADPADLKKILGSLKPVLGDFVGEVQRSLNFFTNTHRDAQIEYMVGMGNAFRLPGLNKYLAEKLQLDVRKVTKMQRLEGDDVVNAPIFNENVLSFGVAYGLGLQGLARARLLTNLLPPEIRMERLVRAKKPAAVAAAGLLLLGLGASALGAALGARTYGAPQVATAVEKANNVKKQADTAESTFKSKKDAALNEDNAVKAIVAGQFERENWLHLTKFLAEAIPQPDGKNLPPEFEKRYWEVKASKRDKKDTVYTGKEAYAEYLKRTKEGPKAPAMDEVVVDPLPAGIDDLIQFNIQSIDCRFSDDLKAFWSLASVEKNEADVRPPDQFKKPPEGKGWVIEISGYTFHRGKEAFVRNTLMENIARLSAAAAPKAADGMPMGGMPMGGMPPADGMAGAAEKVDDVDSVKKPVEGRISHTLLYKYRSRETSDTTGFELIGTGHVGTLAGGQPAGGLGGGPGGLAGPGGMGPMGMMPGPGGSGGDGGGAAAAKPERGAWVPLSSRAGGAGGVGGPGFPGGPGGPMSGGYRGSSTSMPMMPGGPMSGITGGTGATMPNPGNHTRTEFVIVLIWQEPLPSNALRCPEGEGIPVGNAPSSGVVGPNGPMPGPGPLGPPIRASRGPGGS
jgi:type IV pilus assembly protein PilM